MVAATSDRLLQIDSEGVPVLGPYPQWFKPDFDDQLWLEGQGQVGTRDSNLGVDLTTTVADQFRGIYTRRKFHIPEEQAASQGELKLELDYQDGAVVYLNGREIVRRNLGPKGAFVFADQPAFAVRTPRSPEIHHLGIASNHLIEGENLLAVEIRKHLAERPMLLSVRLIIEEVNRPVILIEDDDPVLYQAPATEPSGGLYDPSLHPEFSDWVELHNPGDDPVDLSGWQLADASGQTLTFPAGVAIPAGGFFLILATDTPERSPLYFHAPFQLDQEGETLVLKNDRGEEVDTLTFPEQSYFHSYGRHPTNGTLGFFERATPGRSNPQDPLAGRVSAPAFQIRGGFHDAPIPISMKTSTPEARLYFTIDGTVPTPETGRLYTEPLQLTEKQSLAFRVRGFRDGWIPSETTTSTFLVGQPDLLRQQPAMCLTADPGNSLFHPNGITAIEGGYRLLNGEWTPSGPDDYNLPKQRGRPYERPGSLEVRYPDGSGLQRDVGLRIAGSDYSRARMKFTQTHEPLPWYGTGANKPSFNIRLREIYGHSVWGQDLFQLGTHTYDQIRLRGGNNDYYNPFVRDELVRRLFVRMGHVGSRGMIASLFVNGDFKGYYNPVESLEESFFQER
ncbi:MAG: lamin tail domain-containing protein, partial [Verrucomicrobiota bacterium]